MPKTHRVLFIDTKRKKDSTFISCPSIKSKVQLWFFEKIRLIASSHKSRLFFMTLQNKRMKWLY